MHASRRDRHPSASEFRAVRLDVQKSKFLQKLLEKDVLLIAFERSGYKSAFGGSLDLQFVSRTGSALPKSRGRSTLEIVILEDPKLFTKRDLGQTATQPQHETRAFYSRLAGLHCWRR